MVRRKYYVRTENMLEKIMFEIFLKKNYVRKKYMFEKIMFETCMFEKNYSSYSPAAWISILVWLETAFVS